MQLKADPPPEVAQQYLSGAVEGRIVSHRVLRNGRHRTLVIGSVEELAQIPPQERGKPPRSPSLRLHARLIIHSNTFMSEAGRALAPPRSISIPCRTHDAGKRSCTESRCFTPPQDGRAQQTGSPWPYLDTAASLPPSRRVGYGRVFSGA